MSKKVIEMDWPYSPDEVEFNREPEPPTQEQIDCRCEAELQGAAENVAHAIVRAYLNGQTFCSMGIIVKSMMCSTRDKGLLQYLPTRKRPNNQWIEGSWIR